MDRLLGFDSPLVSDANDVIRVLGDMSYIREDLLWIFKSGFLLGRNDLSWLTYLCPSTRQSCS